MKNFILLCFAFIAVAFATSCKKATTLQAVGTDSLKIGLIAYYPFNNSGADSSGNGNDVAYYVNMTPTTDRFNKSNSAFYFDGTSSYMIVPDNTSLRLSNTDFTINTWINLAVYNSSYGSIIIDKRGSVSNSGWNYGITGYADQINNNITLGITSFALSGGSDPVAFGTTAIGLNQWHMLTTVYSLQRRQLSFYIDGILNSVTNNIPSPNGAINTNMYIGQDSQTSTSTSYFLKGKLDDIRLYNRALSIAQIQKLLTLPY